MKSYDVAVIGAGHNGFGCPAYLLKKGYSVAPLKERSIPGGATSGTCGHNCASTCLNAQQPIINRLKEMGKTVLPKPLVR